MTRATTLIAILSLFACLFVLPGVPAFAQNQSDDEQKAELRDSFKQRYPALARLQDQGLVGETDRGLAEVVKPEYASRKVDASDKDSPTIAAFVAAENRDRNALYALLAKELKTTADKVARRDAMRRFEKAESNHWLHTQKNGWVQKQDLKKQDS